MKAARGEVNTDSGRLFSLVTVSRTFDLEAASANQKRVLVRAFRFLIRNMSRGRPSGYGGSSSAVVPVARTVGGRYGGMSGGPAPSNRQLLR